jgi:ABC-type sugar transport system substrate-binding protein
MTFHRFMMINAITGSVIGTSVVAPQSMLRGERNMPSQAQTTVKIVMVPKFTGTAYFAATEKGAKEAVAELNEKGVAVDFLYTGPSVANTDEEIRMIDGLIAQKPDAIIFAASNADAMVPVAKKAKTSGIKVITYPEMVRHEPSRPPPTTTRASGSLARVLQSRGMPRP